eukprot:GHRR01028457.1.p1 GENE.GHRR01028457.1~~GHRR01028457.1.p1  ORF type:complete len:100 (+),score=7.95 GHRR01028457.1:345-644(+)
MGHGVQPQYASHLLKPASAIGFGHIGTITLADAKAQANCTPLNTLHTCHVLPSNWVTQATLSKQDAYCFGTVLPGGTSSCHKKNSHWRLCFVIVHRPQL